MRWRCSTGDNVFQIHIDDIDSGTIEIFMYTQIKKINANAWTFNLSDCWMFFKHICSNLSSRSNE